MNRFRTPLITAATLAGLAVIGSLMNSHPARLQGAGGTLVSIDPTQFPLRTAGTTTVTGTVSVSQSGLWAVQVADNSTPFSANCLGPKTHSGPTCTYTVPAGKRLVIEGITAAADVVPGDLLLNRVDVGPTSGLAYNSSSTGASFTLPMTLAGSNGYFNFYGLNQKTLLQIDAGGTIQLTMAHSTSAAYANTNGNINLSGHYEPMN